MKIAIYGCGNMATALVEGIYQKNKEIEFHTFTPSQTRAKELASKVNGTFHQNLTDFPECDYYMIACKPQQVEELADSLRGLLPNDANIISILAGTGIAKLKKLFNSEKVIRVMPNTPCMVGEGVNLVCSSPETDEEAASYIVDQLESISKVFVLDKESQIDDYVGISGSGPAYIFELARILSNKGISLGLESKEAIEMVGQMILGSAKLLLNSEDDPETLRNKVTSKRGVTFEALETLKEYRIEEAFDVALERAKKRSIELGN